MSIPPPKKMRNKIIEYGQCFKCNFFSKYGGPLAWIHLFYFHNKLICEPTVGQVRCLHLLVSVSFCQIKYDLYSTCIQGSKWNMNPLNKVKREFVPLFFFPSGVSSLSMRIYLHRFSQKRSSLRALDSEAEIA